MFKISIIIATYNSAKTLRQTLESIACQTYSNIEVIVVDGLSNDNTIEIVNEYKNIVTRVVSENDKGIYDAFNKGIILSTGDYIAFIGSDDSYCNKNVIADIVRNIDKNVSVLSAPIIIVDEVTKLEYFMNNRITKDEILSGKMIPHPGMFVKRDVMKRYMFNVENKIISDYEFLVKYILDGGSVKFVDFPIVYFSNCGVSSDVFGSSNWNVRLLEHIRLLEKLGLGDALIEKLLDNFLDFNKENSIRFNFIKLIKSVLKKYKIYNLAKYLLGKNKKHKCSLKYCRWCKRTI